ncbi:Retrovirus-related Pol polyprotein from transposon TNT 1-94 [Senna tora]|uniref:Retrovirus-related Pol polyprotein from transposon TNT 1-94 n=1 Tax=Senna tora TaxID=362788 RepID=A0A834T0U4_9FABA|nr:Retrovirus-related Pol polyprotein from transposon TNT 1-94 [Senna tora]
MLELFHQSLPQGRCARPSTTLSPTDMALSEYSTSQGDISQANESLSDVAGIDEVILSDIVILKLVLFVPKLKWSLLSIGKMTHDSNCKTEFSPSLCSFQDLESRKIIGNARVKNGLYRIDVQKKVASNKQSFTAAPTKTRIAVTPPLTTTDRSLDLHRQRSRIRTPTSIVVPTKTRIVVTPRSTAIDRSLDLHRHHSRIGIENFEAYKMMGKENRWRVLGNVGSSTVT